VFIYTYILQCRKIDDISFTLSYLIINTILLKYENLIKCCVRLYFNNFINYRSFKGKRRAEVISSSSVIVGVNTSHRGELPLGWSANAQEVISNYGREETLCSGIILFIKGSLGGKRRRIRPARDVARMGRNTNAHKTAAEELK
jgi:hypothetical protein